MIKTKIDINDSVIGSISREIEYAVHLKKIQSNETEMLIHEYRKIVKRIRAILRLIRPLLKEKTFFDLDFELSQIAKSIATARDTGVNLRSLLKLDSISKEKLPKEIKTRAITELSKQYKLAYLDSEGGLNDRLEGVLFHLHIFLNKLNKTELGQSKPDQMFRSLTKSYYKAARLYKDAYSSLDKEVIHKWRKSNKRLLLQLIYFPLDLVKEEKIVSQLHKLTDILGTDHDYAELESNLSHNLNLTFDEVQILHRIIDNLRLKIQKKAFEIGRELYSQPINIYSAVPQ